MNFAASFTEFVKGLDYASGTASRDAAIIDTVQWEAVCAVLKLEALTGGVTITFKLEESNDSGMAGPTDVAGATLAIVDTDDLQLRVLDYLAPTKRYVRAKVVKAVGTSAESLIYLVYGPKIHVPQNTVAATIATLKLLASQGPVA